MRSMVEGSTAGRKGTHTFSRENTCALPPRDGRVEFFSRIWLHSGMIHESYPWKRELARDADTLERWSQKPAHSERRDVLFERKLFISAYSMRKLLEARKLSSAIEAERFACRLYPWKGKALDFFNNYRFEDAFDFVRPVACHLPLRDLVNVIIHSLVFVFSADEANRMNGFMCTSDQRQRTGLYSIELFPFLSLMRRVSTDWPSTSKMVRGRDGLVKEYWQGHGEPPPDVRAKLDAAMEATLREWKTKSE